MSKFDLRPAVPNYKCSNGSGRDAERIFREECERRGIFYGKVGEENDIGIDVITYCIDEQGKKIYKNVQITIASKQTHPKTYLVNKKIKDIRSDIDIVAIYVPYKSTQPEQANINTGKVGDHGFWFLIPIEVYTHPDMYKNYCNTVEVWAFNAEKRFKPPIDRCLNQWCFLTREDMPAPEYFF